MYSRRMRVLRKGIAFVMALIMCATVTFSMELVPASYEERIDNGRIVNQKAWKFVKEMNSVSDEKLDDDFGAKPEELYEVTMHDINEVIEASEEVREFCLRRGASRKHAMMLGLFIEEMAGNTVEYGYGAGKKASVDLRFVFHDGSGVIRLRDDGAPFDPVRWLDKNSEDDPASGLGIRMVTGLAKNVNYMASMEMNNLVITL